MLTSHLHLVPRLGMSGIVSLFPVVRPWYGQDNLNVCVCVCVCVSVCVSVYDVNFACPVALFLSLCLQTHTLQGTHECCKRCVAVNSPHLMSDPSVGLSFMKRTEVRNKREPHSLVFG